jgi:hypothetical protein
MSQGHYQPSPTHSRSAAESSFAPHTACHARRVKQPATDHIEAVLDEVMTLMREAFAEVDYHPEPGSALDQLSLLDGDEVVQDYIEHGEVGLAFDHLLYMVEEPPLPVSHSAREHIRAAAAALRVPPSRLDFLRQS